MKKILITGISGFAGFHLYNLLSDENYKIAGIDNAIKNREHYKKADLFECDINDSEELNRVLKDIKPDQIYHLAAFVHVGRTEVDPVKLFKINVDGTTNLLKVINEIIPEARVLITGSAEEYGIVDKERMPILENYELNPKNLYGLSKKFQEEVGMHFQKVFGMDIIFTRTFHYFGPYQPLNFVFSDFASQIIDIEDSSLNYIKVGNLKAERDFTDIRDVVSAYKLLMEKGKTGEVYNVCSNVTISIDDILKRMLAYSNKKIDIIVDENKLRPLDVPRYLGNNNKLIVLGWERKNTFENSIRDVVDYWRKVKEKNCFQKKIFRLIKKISQCFKKLMCVKSIQERFKEVMRKIKEINKEYLYISILLIPIFCIYVMRSSLNCKGYMGDELSQSFSALKMLKTGNFFNIYFIYGDSCKFIYLFLDMLLYIYGVLKGFLNAITYMDPAYFVYYDRIFNSFLSTISGLLIYLIGKDLYNKKTGYLAAIFLLTNSWFVESATWTKTDAVAMFFLLLTTYVLIKYLDTNKGLILGAFLAGYTISLKLTTFPVLALPWLVYFFNPNNKENILERVFNIKAFYILISILAGVFILAPNTYMIFSRYIYSTVSFFFGVKTTRAQAENSNLYIMCKSVIEAIQGLTGKYMFWIAVSGIIAGFFKRKAVFISIMTIMFFILYFKTPYTGAVIKPHTFLAVYVFLCLFGAIPVVYIFDRLIRNKIYNKLSILFMGIFLVYPSGIKPVSQVALKAFKVIFVNQKAGISTYNEKINNKSFEKIDSVAADWHICGEFKNLGGIVTDGIYSLYLSGVTSTISQNISISELEKKKYILIDLYPVVYSELLKSHLFIALKAFGSSGNFLHDNTYTIIRTGNFNWRELDIDWSKKYVSNEWNTVKIPFKDNFKQDGLNWCKVDYINVTVGITSFNQGLDCVIDNFRVE
ncbi:MAG: GDP-mannose 4,6-dehydratase [Elusimicrobia bacterium]|nr:GDP-mannose 4,6-dehydratase [Candidatus Liberimonas magnetica]